MDNENNPENIDQEMIVDAIIESQEFMNDTAPPWQSQQPMVPLLFDNLHAHNIDVNEDNLSLSSLREETIIGHSGFDLEKSRRPQAHGPGTTTNNEYESSFIFNFSSTVNSEHLKVMYTNVDSFMNKRDELGALIQNKSYDVIALTEILPKNNKDQFDISSVEWKMDGYDMFISPPNVFTKRGCLMYTKEELNALQLDSKIYQFVEYVQLGIHFENGKKFLISCIYRSPSATTTTCIAELNEIILTNKVNNKKYYYLLYVGDFNYKEIDWENNNTNVGPECLASKFLESGRDTYLYQHVKQATRYRGDNQPSLLDLILTNEEEMIDNVVHNAPLGNSDHEILEFNFKLGRNENTRSNQQSLRFFKGNYDEINRLLANTDWDLELAQGDIDELWNKGNNKITELRTILQRERPNS